MKAQGFREKSAHECENRGVDIAYFQ